MAANVAADTDVLVVGGGLAGHCAALAAAEAGARVTLLEKQPRTGGSTVLSGGFMAFAGTDEQRAAGLADDAALLLRDLQAIGGGEADESLLQAYAQAQEATYRWLKRHGVVFKALEHSAGQSVARSHQTDTASMLDGLARAFLALPGTQLWTRARAVALVRDGAQGPVTGAEVERTREDGAVERLHVHCRGGVVLATGGFSRSEELLRQFAPDQARAVRIGGAGSTGDGLRMAWRLGADLRDMARVRGTFGTHPDCSAEHHEILLAFYLGAIVVNQQAARFVDESLSYKLIGDACLRQPGAVGYQVFDQAIMDQSQAGVTMFDFQSALERGLLRQADTLEALADACGLDRAALAATVARYNAGVDAGSDPDHGRNGLCHHAGRRVRVDRAPYYGYLSTSAVLATYCGVRADTDACVRDVHGERIDGLYAAGEVVGGFHGQAYMTGSSLGKAALFGRTAGRTAARGASA
ncbi:FAD-dependent oxidoreductase [Bordetella genomosp. 13]|uniref:FAD-dependent oxidoreductase n=1 Tax=Bordetella genomosp. 13 TaxID=463040 RepID=UPI0011A4F851|nr:FAD-dependent oxidoreductase [Bordetella genomosp. 13]